MKKNLVRMLDMVEEVFKLNGDPDQLDVDDEVRKKLEELHSATLSERATEDGPYAWLLIFLQPTN